MGKCYSQLSGDERNELQRGLNEGMSLRALARSMGRNPSTLSREYRRGSLQSSYIELFLYRIIASVKYTLYGVLVWKHFDMLGSSPHARGCSG